MSAAEIINLAFRHRHKLKGLRLRDVHLKEGDLWKDVLASLRSGLPRLQWVSLRRIGYVPEFEEMQNGGAEVPDDQPWALSDSDSDDEMDGQGAGPSETNHLMNGNHVNGHGQDRDNGMNSIDVDSEDPGVTSDLDFDEGTDDEHEFESHATEFPNLDSPTVSASRPLSDNLDDLNFRIAVEELEDDGVSVSNTKRKSWEKWVVQRAMHPAR